MALSHITNEVENKVALFGTEVVPGQAVVPTDRLNGTFESSKSRAIRRRREATGGYDGATTLTREQASYSGTYGEDLTFETFPKLMRYAVQAGGTGVAVSGSSGAAFQYRKAPDFARDNIDSMTVVHGIEGLAFQSTGVRVDEFTISADATDADDAWKFSSNLFLRDKTRLPGSFAGIATGGSGTTIVMTGAAWPVDAWEGGYVYLDYGSHIGQVRQIAGNTADTLTLDGPALSPAAAAGDVFHIAALLPVVSDPDRETITLEGTKLFLDRYDPDEDVIGTTDVSERVLSFNVTQQLNLAQKRRFPGIIGLVGRGDRWISGTVRFEFDRWDEYKEWEEDDFVSLRIEKEGSALGGGIHKRARIDVPKAAWDVPTEDADNNNMTLSLSFLAFLPEADDIAVFDAINGLSTL